MTERVAQIAARLEAAAPTPWECDGFADSGHVHLSLFEGTSQGRVIASDITRNEDADLLFNAPADIGYLLTELTMRDKALAEAWAEGHAVGRTDEWSLAENPYRSES